MVGMADAAKARIAERTAQMDDALVSAQQGSKAAIAAAAAEAMALLNRRNAQTTDRSN